MVDKTVPVGDSIRRGWEIFKGNAFFLVVIFVIVSVAYAIIERAEAMGEGLPYPAELLIRMGYFIVVAIIEIGIINVCLRFIDGLEAKFEDLTSAIGVLVKYLIASFLYGMMVGLGILLFVIPGVYLAIKFGFYGYFIVDENLDPLDALKSSSQLTDCVKLELLFFFLSLIAVNILGLLCLGVGVFVSWPVTRLAVANAYRELRKQTTGDLGGVVISQA
jgi:uncharacterized membrane protein